MRMNIGGMRGRAGACFILPSVLGVFVFVIVPFLDVVRRSFFGAMNGTFVGLQNYASVLQNRAFQLAAGNTLRFMGVCMPLLLVLSLVVALALYGNPRCAGAFKTTFLVPMAVPIASVVLLWQALFHQNGLLNSMLDRLGGQPVAWMDSGAAFYVLVGSYIWKNLGYNVILFMTGLNAIPPEYREAAQLDGASKIRTFFQITLPLLKPTTFFVLLMSIINSLKIFREIYQMSGGYPNDNIYFVQHFMNNNFENLNYSRLCTAAVILSLIFSVIMFFVFRLEKKSTELG